jgi:hypothetical protein
MTGTLLRNLRRRFYRLFNYPRVPTWVSAGGWLALSPDHWRPQSDTWVICQDRGLSLELWLIYPFDGKNPYYVLLIDPIARGRCAVWRLNSHYSLTELRKFVQTWIDDLVRPAASLRELLCFIDGLLHLFAVEDADQFVRHETWILGN